MLLRAIEDKRFLPVGADREVTSDFQLLAGTHRDLDERVREGRFRVDLLARINLWTFRLPGLAERPEDIEPNLGDDRAAALDRFDLVQLEDVLAACAAAPSLSAAGRLLFAASRAKKASPNDADRLRQYLARFDLTFDDVAKALTAKPRSTAVSVG